MGVIFSRGGSGSGSDMNALSVYVIDQDSTAISQQFVETLAESKYLQLTSIDLEQAEEDVRLGKKAAYILIKNGYGDARENMFTSEAPVVEIGIDPSRNAESNLLTGLLMQHGAQDMQKIFTDSDLMRQQVQTSLQALPATESTGLGNFLTSLDSYLADNSISANDDDDWEW